VDFQFNNPLINIELKRFSGFTNFQLFDRNKIWVDRIRCSVGQFINLISGMFIQCVCHKTINWHLSVDTSRVILDITQYIQAVWTGLPSQDCVCENRIK